MKDNVSLFLDSGAYSAFTKGATIDIQEYISFIKEHKKNIEVYANLDVIGDPEATYENQKIMEKAGLKPLPCFHYGEDEKYLNNYLKDGHKYIAFGGMVPVSTPLLTKWLDKLFLNHIPENIKIHGFGVTSLKLLIRYPWYSVDSTSWIMTSAMGAVFVPKGQDGKYIYDENSLKVNVSSTSPKRHQPEQHILSMQKKDEVQHILDYFEFKGYKLGKSKIDDEGNEVIIEPGLCNNYRLRDELNIIYFMDLEQALPEWPWKFTYTGLQQLI